MRAQGLARHVGVLVQLKNHRLTPAATILSEMIIETIRAGSLLDDSRYGLPANKALNFM